MLSINLVYRLPQHVKTFVTTARHWALPRATARMFVRYRALNMVARLNTPTKTQFATGWTVQGWNPGGVEGGGQFSAIGQTDPVAHPTFCTMGTG